MNDKMKSSLMAPVLMTSKSVNLLIW